MDIEPKSQKKFNPYLPIIITVVLIIGILIGTLFNFNEKGVVLSKNPHSAKGKLENVLEYIVQNYVDTITHDSLQEMTLAAMLHSLDPHSDYIPAQDLQQVNEPLEGNFEGIGIEFNILNDTVVVVNTISGGPSEQVGMQAGDKLIKVDGKNIAGIKITNKQIFEKLRGKGGTKVILEVKRATKKELLKFSITRGEIPIFSIDVACMLNSEIGIIKVNRFGATTFKEYNQSFNKLKKLGMKKLILDLRGNGGGYLNAAVDLADEFLKKNMQIVYTKGKASQKQLYQASDRGSFENNPLVVLIDEGSASASEILAGAIQDNDRGLIIGRRSFGKGLVQEQIEMPDGSALRLTTARYYTPSGRCIQKSYSEGLEAYYNEENERYTNGELLSADSIKLKDTLNKYYTVGGKVVYGGGGIMPDVFVPIDTSFRSSYLTKVAYSGIINDFAFNYADKNRTQLKKSFPNAYQFIQSFALNESVFDEFILYAAKNKVEQDPAGIKRSGNYLKMQLKALIGRNLYNNEAYYPVLFKEDPIVQKAIENLK